MDLKISVEKLGYTELGEIQQSESAAPASA